MKKPEALEIVSKLPELIPFVCYGSDGSGVGGSAPKQNVIELINDPECKIRPYQHGNDPYLFAMKCGAEECFVLSEPLFP
jgi:hypothetical protein